jgi:hypothetical protein
LASGLEPAGAGRLRNQYRTRNKTRKLTSTEKKERRKDKKWLEVKWLRRKTTSRRLGSKKAYKTVNKTGQEAGRKGW